MDYKELYFNLFNQITDVIQKLEEIQCKAEELYVQSDIEHEMDEVMA